MEPLSSFDTPCEQIRREFGLIGVTVPGGDGFVVINSSRHLEVVAVYTSRSSSKSGLGTSVDVEYIRPKIMEVQPDPRPKDGPDLTIELVNPKIAVVCPTGQGSCIAVIEFVAKNISDQGAPAYQVDEEAVGTGIDLVSMPA